MFFRNLLIFIVAALASWYLIKILMPAQAPGTDSAVLQAVPQVKPSQGAQAGGFVADISVHTIGELELIFDRVEQLLDRPRADGEVPLISIVLHGPEVQFFAIDNYASYKPVVDRAARLSALGGVDISICQTRMRDYNLGESDVPNFLRQVPYGPDELEGLLENGYITM